MFSMGIVLLENDVVDIELTTRLEDAAHSRQSNPLPEVWQAMESERRRDRSCRLVEMFVGEKSGM
jgi:hypothetical protein